MNRRRKKAGLGRLGRRMQRRRTAQFRLPRGRASNGTNRKQGLFIFGAVVTVLYVVGVPWLYFGHLDVAQWLVDIRALDLNAYGSFLAGTVIPLTLLWLTLAVIKHGQDLNTQAVQLMSMLEQNKQRVDVAQRNNRREAD